MYLVNEKRYHEDSKINREIAKAFVIREVRFQMTDFVSYVLDTGKPNNAPPFTFESIDYGLWSDMTCPYCGDSIPDEPVSVSELHLTPELNEDPDCDPEERYVCPVCAMTHPSYDAARECCDDAELYQCSTCEHVFSSVEIDELTGCEGDANEWWAVTPWLYEKLKEAGAITIEEYHLWGRIDTSDKLPVYEDEFILEICKDLEILDGQKNSWAKHIKLPA